VPVAASVLCVLLAAFQAMTGTLSDASTKTRVRGIDLPLETAPGREGEPSPGTHRGIDYTYGETASDPSRQCNGRVYDPETGFHDYGARMYWPQIGRFVSADTYAGDIRHPASLNRYSYVLNNPYKYVDPDGKTPLVVGALAMAAAGGVGAVIGSYIDHGKVDWDYVSRWTSTGFLAGMTTPAASRCLPRSRATTQAASSRGKRRGCA